MTTPDPQAVIADLLGGHRGLTPRLVTLDGDQNTENSEAFRFRHACTCGWSVLVDTGEGHDPFTAHLTTVLAADPRIAIVALPQGETTQCVDGAWTQVWDGPIMVVETWRDAGGAMLSDSEFRTSAELSQHAAALLAAGRAAGEQS